MRLYFWSSVKDENWARTASVDVMMKLDVTNKRGGATELRHSLASARRGEVQSSRLRGRDFCSASMKQVLFAIVVLFLTTLWSVTTLLVVLFRLVTDRKRALKKTARNSEAHYRYNYI